MKLLITGGLGHIGSYLIRNLPQDIEIVVYDNMHCQRYCSLFNLPRPIEFHEKSFTEITPDDLTTVNCVLHLAAITDATNSKREDIQEINIDRTLDFIDVCFDVVPRFIFPSSTSVYGHAAETVYEDDDKFINPQSFYAKAKLEIENYIKRKITLTKWLILRMGTICGVSPGMRFHTAINAFCYQSTFKHSVTVWKQNYEMVRPYLTLRDLQSCILHLIDKPKLWNQTYNVVSDNIKLSNIVNFIDCYFTQPLGINFVDTPLLNQYSYLVNTNKLCNTGFNFENNIYTNIKETLSLLNNYVF